MLRVTYSNRTEALVEALVADLAEVAPLGDPFAEITVVVPNRAVAGHLELALARARGVAANLRVPFLDGFLTEVAEASAPGHRVLDRARLQALLRTALCDETLLARDELAPVARYLGADDDPGARALRRLQLAGQLAMLLAEYSLTRPEMVAAWPRGPVLADGPQAAVERWQRALYLAIFGADGSGWQGADERRHLPLVPLFERIPPADIQAPSQLYLLGFSSLAKGYGRCLGALGQRSDVHVLAQNPCGHYWEDLDGSEPAPLRLWGRPGRDLIRQLNGLSEGDFEPRFVDPRVPGAGALQLLQADVLARVPDRAAPHGDVRAGDDTVRILACPNPRRELEIIAGRIWHHLDRDPSLRLCDVAVLVAPSEIERYRPHVAAVFAELGGLPVHVADAPLAAESRLAQALEALLDLPLGRFTRPDVLGLVTHPAVVGRYPEVDPSDWIRWADRLGVVHGADAADHQGTYIVGDHFHWDQGIRRLALGAFMSGETSGERRVVKLESRSFVPEELAEDELESAARFALLLRSLLADARWAAGAAMPLSRWARTFELLASTYLTALDQDEERALERCRRALAGLADLDLDGAALSYREARELARDALGVLRVSRGQAPTRGVTLAPLAPMRALPFRIVFAAGLGEGCFPATDRDSALDLRGTGRTVGEVSPRERDRYAFLEALLSARDHLYLSYVARNEQTGEELSPSPVVLELRDLLRRAYLTPEDAAALEDRHPLRRYHPRYQGEHDGSSQVDAIGARQAGARALRADLVRHCAERGAAPPDRATLLSTLRRVPEVAERLGLPRPIASAPAPRAGATDEPVVLSLSRLRKFLEAPLTAWARTVVGLRDGDLEDLASRSDEPFESARLDEAMLLRDVFLGHLRAGDGSLAARYRARADLEALSGRAPIGLFGERERARHQRILDAWEQALGGHVGAPLCARAFGRAREGESVEELAPPITAEHDGQRFELVGTTEPVLGDLGTLILVDRPKSADRHLLRGLFDHVVLGAAGVAPAGHRVAIVSESELTLHPLRPWSPDEARAYLGALAADLVGRPHDYLFPCEAPLRAARKGEPVEAALAALVRGPKHAEAFGPVAASRVALPDDPEALAEARFAPLLSRLEQGLG